MRIGLDIRMLNNSGIGVTIQELLNNFSESQRKQMVLFSKPDEKGDFFSKSVSVPYSVYSLKQHFFYPALLNRERLSFFHMPHFDVPYFYKGPFISTVHDLIHLIFPEFSTKHFSSLYAKSLLSHVSKKAKAIIVVSQNTKKDLISRFPDSEERVHVIHPGVDSHFKPVDNDSCQEVINRLGLPETYILFVGNIRRSKNSDGLIRAYQNIRRTNQKIPSLVLVGNNFFPQYEKGFPEGIIQLSNISRADLPAVYSKAEFFVFPSFYEGFGLPPLEAMACGTPVLASNRASLPEVCGDAALFVDPSISHDLERGMIELWESSSLKTQLRNKGLENVKRFSWMSFADKTWGVYEKVGRELGEL